MTTLASLPEELLERILAHTVIAPPAPHPRAPWHQGNTSTKDTRSRMAPLLVCRAFHRIALPFFYHTLVLHSPRQSAALLVALRAQPDLARGVRVLVLPSPSASDAAVLSMLPKLLVLDVTLPNSAEDDLTRAVRDLRTLQELSVRKTAGTYLSQPAPRAMLDALSSAVLASPQLTSTALSFPLSGDPALATLTTALAAAPALHTLRTPLPAMWAHAYAEVAANPALERRRATFTSFSGPASQPRPILPTALFLRAARPHARLSELIRTGTHVMAGGWRGRSATVGGATA
ncbi:hypothetical protein DFH08DRAFT_717152 [Mycena albidolilacea]|uniref:F-box domain-containing protein n=1 Tax=Mycena albidolilacea TaxID=1033008 RepID=A0AAD6ZA23_9AGAR|nr:hypothetical protein DFH08DRAFT_717152 [Mycena albidolilacea]